MGCCIPSFAGELERTFICLEIPSVQRSALAAWINEHRNLTDEIRWVRAENLHITLKFCGERPHEIVQQILKKLSNRKPTGELTLALSGIGAFPKLERARVVYTGIEGQSGKLIALAKEVSRIAQSCGAELSQKAFTPHVTLGRRTEFCTLSAGVFEALRSAKLQLEPWTATEFIYMRSKLLPTGAQYSEIGRFKI